MKWCQQTNTEKWYRETQWESAPKHAWNVFKSPSFACGHCFFVFVNHSLLFFLETIHLHDMYANMPRCGVHISIRVQLRGDKIDVKQKMRVSYRWKLKSEMWWWIYVILEPKLHIFYNNLIKKYIWKHIFIYFPIMLRK